MVSEIVTASSAVDSLEVRAAPGMDPRGRRRGALFAMAGVCCFAPTIPLSKLLVGQIDAFELVFARMILGSCAALAFLGGRRSLGFAILPPVARLPEIAMTALGVVVGFPFLLVLALDRLPATFGSVVSGLLPLVTAALGVWLGRERVSRRFWLPAVGGSALTIYYGLERVA
ncbi:MAG: DMT family transporter, partial [Leptospirales bacterium]